MALQHDQLITDHQQRLKHLEDALFAAQGRLAKTEEEIAALKVREGARAGADEVITEVDRQRREKLEDWQRDVTMQLVAIGAKVTKMDSARRGALSALRDAATIAALILTTWKSVGGEISFTHPAANHPPAAQTQMLEGK